MPLLLLLPPLLLLPSSLCTAAAVRLLARTQCACLLGCRLPAHRSESLRSQSEAHTPSSITSFSCYFSIRLALIPTSSPRAPSSWQSWQSGSATMCRHGCTRPRGGRVSGSFSRTRRSQARVSTRSWSTFVSSAVSAASKRASQPALLPPQRPTTPCTHPALPSPHYPLSIPSATRI